MVSKKPEINIGTAGHVDHGKTSLLQVLTGEWTDKHSEELKRGITIKLGYADLEIFKCPKCDEIEAFSSQALGKERCPLCKRKLELQKIVSFVDSPGHESLMATMLSGAAIIDCAILVIAANEPCPKPQTKEHLKALQILGIEDIIVVQNKLDLVTKERALENYEEIVNFLESFGYKNVPIIPVSSSQKVNIDAVIYEIYHRFKPKKREKTKSPLFLTIRTFDANKAGTNIKDLKGGVLGGAVVRGKFKEGDEIEIKPGVYYKSSNTWKPIYTKITNIMWKTTRLKEATPGGLIALGTQLDPILTKSDKLVGEVVGLVNEVPDAVFEIEIETHLLDYYIGLDEDVKVDKLKVNEELMLNVGTAVTQGVIKSIKDDITTIRLKTPVCVEPGWRVAISRRIKGRWRLSGYGFVV